MKTINSIDDITDINMNDITSSEYDTRYPCWYVEFEKESQNFKVGVKSDIRDDEFIFNLNSIHVNKINMAKELGFAVLVINKYKNGGKKAVRDWISESKI